MRITIDQLRQFQAVVRYKNLNLAAEKMAISPSAVSRSIKIIEEDLGHLLFERKGRNILLNREGKIFYEKSLETIRTYDSLFSAIKSTSLEGKIKVGASHWIAAKLLPAVLELLVKKYENLNFEVYSLDSNIAISKLLSGDLDIAVCFSPKEQSELDSYEIYKGQLVLCSGKKHPLIQKKAKEVIKNLNNYDAIIHKANEFVFSCDDHPMFFKYDIKPTFKFFWDSDLVAVELLKSGKFWSMVPDIISNSDSNLKNISIPKNWDAPYSIKLLWNKNKPTLNKAIEEIKDGFKLAIKI